MIWIVCIPQFIHWHWYSWFFLKKTFIPMYRANMINEMYLGARRDCMNWVWISLMLSVYYFSNFSKSIIVFVFYKKKELVKLMVGCENGLNWNIKFLFFLYCSSIFTQFRLTLLHICLTVYLLTRFRVREIIFGVLVGNCNW